MQPACNLRAGNIRAAASGDRSRSVDIIQTRSRRSTAAYTLVEAMVAGAVAVLVVLGACGFAFYATRSYSALTNYALLDEQGQLTLDKFTQQVRQVLALTSYTTATNTGAINSLTFVDYDGGTLSFTYDPNTKSLYRIKGGVTNVFLSGCNSLAFTLYQRTPQPFTFDAVSTAVATNCKVVEVTWTSSRNVFANDQANTEMVQSAKVAIRSN